MEGLNPVHRKLFDIVSHSAGELNQPVYVVGGYVRDYYLNRLDQLNPDIDFITVGTGIKLAEIVAKKLKASNLVVFKQFGTAHIRYHGIDIEFVGARKESYSHNSRNPFVENGSLEDDQLRRDFTINALSWSLNEADFGLLLDPFNGIQDLASKTIRTPLDPKITFSDDPLRMMRAIRFATQLDFNIEPETYEGIREMQSRLEIISAERITEELNKIILCKEPSRGFAMLFETGLLDIFLPELSALQGVSEVNNIRHKDNFWHTLQVLDNVSQTSCNLWLRWSALMHDIAKPPTQKFVEGIGWTFHGHENMGATWTKRIFKRLTLPLDERLLYVQKLVRLHLRPIALVNEKVTDSALRRLLFEAGNDIDDLMTLCRADITSKNDSKVKRYLKNFDHVQKRLAEVEEKDRIRNWQPPVSGNEIMQALKLEPGPDVGKIKKAIENAILDGEIPNNHDAAFAFMMKFKNTIHLKLNDQDILLSSDNPDTPSSKTS